jgi:hypothetical protein
MKKPTPRYTYTEKYSPVMMDTHYLATVSFHHYWFKTFDDLRQFWDCDLYDHRMTIAYPTQPEEITA